MEGLRGRIWCGTCTSPPRGPAFPPGNSTSPAGPALPHGTSISPNGTSTFPVGPVFPQWDQHFPRETSTSRAEPAFPQRDQHLPNGTSLSPGHREPLQSPPPSVPLIAILCPLPPWGGQNPPRPWKPRSIPSSPVGGGSPGREDVPPSTPPPSWIHQGLSLGAQCKTTDISF